MGKYVSFHMWQNMFTLNCGSVVFFVCFIRPLFVHGYVLEVLVLLYRGKGIDDPVRNHMLVVSRFINQFMCFFCTKQINPWAAVCLLFKHWRCQCLDFDFG